MNFNFMSDDQLVNFTQQKIAALDQQQAQIFPDYLNPYGGDGFVQNQINFGQAFNSWAWDKSVALAEMWPNDQPIPANLFGTNMEAQTAFDNYFETIKGGSNTMDFAMGEFAGAISGHGTYFTPGGNMVSGVSHMPQFQYHDPIGGGTMGSNVPLTDPSLTPLTAWSTPSFF